MGDLNKRNYVLVLDSSGSMGEPVSRTNKTSRWHFAQEATVAVARKCAELDSDGIDVYTFNKKFKKFANTTPEKVAEIFNTVEPMGGTSFTEVMEDVFETHFAGDKPTTVLVVTDGCPSDGVVGQQALAKLLVKTANRLEGDAELGVEFIQIGEDPTAHEFLKKLDDDLVSAGSKFDIVDTKTMEDLDGMSITDVLLAAVND